MKYIMMFVFVMLLGCANVRQSIGISGKPLSTNADQSIKMNYKIIFGQIRSKKIEESDD